MTSSNPIETKEGNLGKDIHKKYWGFVFRESWNYIARNKKISLTVAVVAVLSAFTYLGYVKYIPEFSLPVGIFKYEKSNIDTSVAGFDSKKLDRSIFDLARETTNLTSQERANLILKISGLETKEENGKIEDIGTDGLAFLIMGNSTDNYASLIRCDFPSSWEQRLSLLKKGTEIKFIGIVSKYEPSNRWIILKNCRISG